jgi:hypothetical protein
MCVPLVIEMDTSSTLMEVGGAKAVIAGIITASFHGSTEITSTHLDVQGGGLDRQTPPMDKTLAPQAARKTVATTKGSSEAPDWQTVQGDEEVGDVVREGQGHEITAE